MKTRRTTARDLPGYLLMAAAVLMSCACLAKEPAKKEGERESALRSAEMARFKASVDNDAAALDRLLDVDLDYTHSNGAHETKARFIAALPAHSSCRRPGAHAASTHSTKSRTRPGSRTGSVSAI